MKVWAFFALAAIGASPAHADLTATYALADPKAKFRIKIEVAANGDMRADLNIPDMSVIGRQGRSYFILADPGGPIVEDTGDVRAVAQEFAAQMSPQVCDRLARSGSAYRLVPKGSVTVVGRNGEAYGRDDRPAAPPEMVISHDPALAPLGPAVAALFRETISLLGQCASKSPGFSQIEAILDSGAPLQWGDLRLDSLETGPIDPARFVLPAAPATREHVRTLMNQPKSTVVRIQPEPGK